MLLFLEGILFPASHPSTYNHPVCLSSLDTFPGFDSLGKRNVAVSHCCRPQGLGNDQITHLSRHDGNAQSASSQVQTRQIRVLTVELPRLFNSDSLHHHSP